MAGYFTGVATQLGIPIWLLVVILVWTAVWKLIALWKSARSGHVVWFVIIAIVNSVGILPILYIYVFSKLGKEVNKNKKSKRTNKKSKKR